MRPCIENTQPPHLTCFVDWLAKWLDENKRFHLKLPTFKPRLLSWAGLKGNVAIPPTERKELLDVLGVFDIPVGDEDIECRKASNYFFRDAEQVSVSFLPRLYSGACIITARTTA